MARAAVEAASPSTLAPALARWLRAAGAHVTPYAPSTLADLDEAPATTKSLALLLSAAAEHLAEPHVALRLPRELTYRRYDAVALASVAAPTPAAVLRAHERWSRLVFPQLDASIREETLSSGERVVRFEAMIAGHPRGLGAHVDEYVLALLLHRFRARELGLIPRRVWLTAPRVRDLAPLVEAFGTREIEFGSDRLGLELAEADAQRTLSGSDLALMGTAEQLASAALGATPRAGALRETVASRIESRLPGVVTADDIAAVLHMSARTLQRRLEGEGTRFTEVLDRVREQTARRLLADRTLSLAEVGYRSGFADLATFCRAFKRWTSIPPGAFRRRSP